METLIHSAIGKTRLEIAAGRLNQEHWHSALDEKNKEEYRKLGQQLMSTLLTLLREPSANVDIDSQARDLGKLYARLSLRQGNRIADILHAYFFFRDYVFEGLFQLSSVSQGTSANDMLETYRQLGRFTNTMLISIVESFSEASRPT